jgi:CO/xanthine dehydrogenase FAD-binding subunit
VSVATPATLDEALAVLAADPTRAVLAGGTDLMVEINFGHRAPESVLALHRVAALRAWSRTDDSVVIGSGVTCATLERAPLADLVPALGQAARTVGSPQIRAAATIGGNLATASPAGDLLPVLSALDATVRIAHADSARASSIHDFLVGPKRSSLGPGELVVGVEVPVRAGRQEFLKVGTRNAMVISVASVAMAHVGDRLQVALGSVGPTVLRARDAEAWFAARGLDVDAIDEFGERVAAEARPIDDHRSTADYRRHAVRVCATRAASRILRRDR